MVVQQKYRGQSYGPKNNTYNQCKRPGQTRNKTGAEKQSSGKTYKEPACEGEHCIDDEEIHCDWNLPFRFVHVKRDQPGSFSEGVVQEVMKKNRIARHKANKG